MAFVPESPEKKPDQLERLRQSAWQQYKMEAAGVLVIALLILVVAIVHYWRYISWSLR